MVLFYLVAIAALAAGFIITERRVYTRTAHPHSTHSLGMLLIGTGAGMGLAQLILTFTT